MGLVCKNVMTFNVNGLRDFSKRRQVFNHLHHISADIVMLQETHSDKKCEKLWKSEWGGTIIFSHGDTNARGVAILFSKTSKFKILKTIKDDCGRVLAVVINANNRQYVLASIYAPNRDIPQFYVDAFALINSLNVDLQIIVGDFNTVLRLDQDILGGMGHSNCKTREFLNMYFIENDLVDVWREQHPQTFRSTFIKRNPVILMERLDYIIISSALKQNVVHSDILPSLMSDHAIPVIQFNFVSVKPGKGYWKFNNLLLHDETFIDQAVEAITDALVNLRDLSVRERWEMMKLAIWDRAIVRGIQVAKSRNNKIAALEKSLKRNIEARDQDKDFVLFHDYDVHISNIQMELEELTSQRTQGAIIRSQSNWVELGERNNSFFLNLEKHNFNKKVITHIRNPRNGSIITEPKEILNVLNNYFEHMFQHKDTSLDLDYLATIKIPQISDKDRYMLDGPIQLEEIHLALKQMRKSKCPGVDGLTPEFYLKFWPLLATTFKALFTEVVNKELLHSSARDGVFALLDKPNKDLLDIPNWRPLTLLNTDYKLFAKVLANRLLHVLPSIIGEEQFGYMKGRSISDNLLDLFSVIQHCEEKNLEALLISVDFSRAYDSVSWQALKEILRAFGFGEQFIDMVMICFTDIHSAVMNNNTWSKFIFPKVGLRQGCVLSCYLFIIVTQIISLRINQNDQIKGIKMGSMVKKSDQYVDDLWNVIQFELSSYQELLFEYSEFEDFTGLSINYNKTEVMRIGSLYKTNAKFYSDLPLKWSDGPIRVLGMYVHPQYTRLLELNYDDILLKVENLFHVWNTRSLTPVGKITVINALCNSQFVYKLQSLPTPPQYIFDNYTKAIREFIWDGKKAKIKLDRLCASYKEGGLQLRDLRLVDKSLKLAKMQTIIEKKHFWTQYFYENCFTASLPIQSLNFKAKDIKKYIQPSFFRDVLYCWAEQNYCSPLDNNDILQQTIWFNSHVRQQGGWLACGALIRAGVTKISHIYNLDYGRFDSFEEFVSNYGELVNFVTYYGIINSIPNKWKQILRRNEGVALNKPVPWVQAFTSTKLKKSKFCFDHLRAQKSFSNDAILQIWNVDLGLSLEINFLEKQFNRAGKIASCVKLWYFQYRIITKKILTNIHISKWDNTVSDLCSFCHASRETVVHLFCECPKVKMLWKALRKWIKHFHRLDILFTPSIIIFCCYRGKVAKLINILILITKFYVYRCKTQGSILKFSDLAVDFVKYKNIEKCIAIRNNKLYKFARKWDDFSIFE